MNPRIQAFRHALAQKKAVKVIAGINNTNLDNVLSIVRAATIARATAVDVAAQPDIIREARQITDLTLFASCINPDRLTDAVHHGADVAELGNYDALYEEGLFFTHDEIIKLAQETLNQVKTDALISVTIPGHLALETQIRMAKELKEMGVDLIQTEGASRALAVEPRIQPLGREQKASITLTNTRTLSQHTDIPLMSASGIGLDNVNDAFRAGASAVGIGSTVNTLSHPHQMIDAIERIMLQTAAHALTATCQTPQASLCSVS